MSITVTAIANALLASNTAIKQHEQDLNAADAKLGDGDTGGMLARAIGKMAELDLSTGNDVGAAFSTLARAATSATGSSLGTLLATALLTIGRETKGRDSIEDGELANLLAKARDAMMARGGAALGDKTVLDSLDAVVQALSRAGEPVGPTAVAAANEALDDFRSRPNRIGRARMFGDATIGVDDPGMLAFARLTEALAGGN